MRYLAIVCFAMVFTSCHTKTDKQSAYFFSLKHFFEKEAVRLTKSKKNIEKLVLHNESSERKNVFIEDWKNELNMFAESDINKPAWRDSYGIVQDKNSIRYHALDSNLRTRSIIIKKDESGKLTQIAIVNKTQNLLYQSREHLVYIPDSIYFIDKKQHVIIIGDNHYQVSGKLN